MLHSLNHYIDSISLLLCTGSIFTLLNDYNVILTSGALFTTIGYNCYKWIKETKRKK
jgi:hypothetical protein